MNERVRYKNDVREVEIQVKRWEVLITIYRMDDSVDRYVASADSFFTDGSGIYFDTLDSQEEYREDHGI